MSESLSSFKKWYENHRKEIVEDYLTFLRFPSISTDPDYKNDSFNCAKWLLGYIKKMGMTAELIETPGFPLVYAEHLQAGKEAETLLIYGHYDVQPVDPLNEWKSPPFEPRIDGEEVYARGAQDNKGQIYYTLVAIRALLSLKGKLAVNLKLCIEGEEESASKGLAQALPKIVHKLQAGSVLIPDVGMPKESPAITMGCRGIMALEISLTGSAGDLHSGEYGGIAYNPNRALVQMLSQLWDKEGRVVVPHFYDDVLTIDPEEKKELDFAIDPHYYSENFSIEALGGEKGYSIKESGWIRPTVEINGLGGGYFGKGFKTVIPSKAVAKISCRLVPNQDPKKIFQLLKDFFQKHLVKGMKMEIEDHGGGFAVRGSLRSDLAKTAQVAYEEVFKKPCKKIMTGGSIPIIGDIVSALKAEVVLMGLGYDDDNIHAPNEHFGLDRLEKGFLIVAHILENFGKHD